MQYRTNRRTGDKISIIGFGSAYISDAGESNGVKLLETAYENGINYYDLAAGAAACFPFYGKAFEGVRDKIMYQIHFGADYTTGEYGWTTDLEKVKKSIDWQLKSLRTDYIDYGFIHCLDEMADWEQYQKNGIFDHVLSLKEQCVIRHIGFSTHTPVMAETLLDTGVVDMLMFSINPGYDFQKGEYAHGSVDERTKLYRRCEKDGIGISVMKPFSGGQLLSAKTSPFGQALTQYQCIQYALDKPGVLSVLPGVSTMDELKKLLGFCNASPEQRDYSVMGSFDLKDAEGRCVYCNHCQPCPEGLDVALINKYYDLAMAGDDMAADHYRHLEKKADECLSCGHCTRRCPFHVDQMERMKAIAGYFA